MFVYSPMLLSFRFIIDYVKVPSGSSSVNSSSLNSRRKPYLAAISAANSLYTKIRENPEMVKTTKKVLTKDDIAALKKFKNQRLNYKQRVNRVQQKIAAFHRNA